MTLQAEWGDARNDITKCGGTAQNLKALQPSGSVMTTEERTMLYAMAFYVFIDALPKCFAFACRVAGWLNVAT